MYAILDIESTGGKYNEEGITEIAIHRFDGHEVVDRFISLINPEREIQPFVAKLTGINSAMLRNAPKFHEVAKRIIEITDGATLVAHNAPFDYRILRTEFRRLGYDYQRKTLCTVILSQTLLPEQESHSLGKLVRSLGIPVSDRHRANGDALATLALFKTLLAKDSEKHIVKTQIREASLGELSPTQLDIVEGLPTDAGVYYMHNKDGDIIYLAHTTNIKKAVNQAFIKSGAQARKLQKETKKVTYERTGNGLVGQLKEYTEILKNKPRYNRKKKAIANATSLHLPYQDFVVIDKGRQAGEQSAVLIRGGRLKGFGFYDLNHQINNIHILESIITPMHHSPQAMALIKEYINKGKPKKIIEL